MRVDERCATSGRALQVASAASEIQSVKINLRKTLQNQSKCMHENRFAMPSRKERNFEEESIVVKSLKKKKKQKYYPIHV